MHILQLHGSILFLLRTCKPDRSLLKIIHNHCSTMHSVTLRCAKKEHAACISLHQLPALLLSIPTYLLHLFTGKNIVKIHLSSLENRTMLSNLFWQYFSPPCQRMLQHLKKGVHIGISIISFPVHRWSTYICLKGGKATDTVKYMQITARGPGSGRPRTGGISWSRIDVVLVLFQFFSKVRR